MNCRCSLFPASLTAIPVDLLHHKIVASQQHIHVCGLTPLLSRKASRCRRPYILPLWFFLFFFLLFWCLSLRSLNGSQPNLDTYSLMTSIWNSCSELPRTFTPSHGLGTKPRFLGPTLNFDQTNLCNETRYQQSEETCQSKGLLYIPPKIWWTLVQKRLRTVGDFFGGR